MSKPVNGNPKVLTSKSSDRGTAGLPARFIYAHRRVATSDIRQTRQCLGKTAKNFKFVPPGRRKASPKFAFRGGA